MVTQTLIKPWTVKFYRNGVVYYILQSNSCNEELYSTPEFINNKVDTPAVLEKPSKQISLDQIEKNWWLV